MSESKGGGMDPELKVDLSNYDRVTPGRANQITLARVNTPTRNILRKFDNNGDGRIDANEIQTIVSTLVAEKFKSKAFKIGLIILGIFTAILLGAMFGLTWAVVAALKDTQVQGGVLVTNDKAANPVMVANMDLTVADGLLISRNSSSVITTSTLQQPGSINGRTSFEKLIALQSLVFIGSDTSRYSLAILGVARIPNNATTDGYVLRFQTAAGTLTLANGTWSASNITGPFLEALFTVTEGQRRRLSEDAGLHVYFICEDGECGEGIPCGLPGLSPCPHSGTITDPGSEGAAPPPKRSNTGGTGGTCAYPTPIVNICSQGLYFCYGPTPTDAQRKAYMAQAGCSSGCKWGFMNRDSECEGNPGRSFCCV